MFRLISRHHQEEKYKATFAKVYNYIREHYVASLRIQAIAASGIV
jgi:hypothetical protein